MPTIPADMKKYDGAVANRPLRCLIGLDLLLAYGKPSDKGEQKAQRTEQAVEGQ